MPSAPDSMDRDDAEPLAEVTFYNVSICIPAPSPELAYTRLCEALAAIGADWQTDTYSLPGGNAQPVSDLYPPEP